jgi:acyl-CoA dehydrogenase
MDFSIPEELREVQNLVRRFVENELAPYEQMVEEKGEIPPDLRLALRKKAISLGLWAMDMPVELGGGGIGALGMVLVNEELGKTSNALASAIGGPQQILLQCNEYQRKRFLLPSIKGERISCFAVTEPDAGSDAARIKTTAVKKGSEWIINGRKHFISSSGYADYCIVFAVTDKTKGARGGITAFLVDMDSPGFTRARLQEMMGQRGFNQHELVFEDCKVSEEQVLGEVGQGFKLAMQSIGRVRLNLNGARAVGVMERLLKMCTEYAKQRVTFGLPIAERQGIQWMLAEISMGIHISRLMCYDAAWDLDRGVSSKELTPKLSMVKLYTSEMAGRAADIAVQIFGGMGYTKEMPLERIYRDVRVLRIWDGTSEIHRDLIARDVLNRL